MMQLSRTLILFLVVFFRAAHGQVVNPPADDVFQPNELAWIFLTMDPADKAFLEDPANALSDDYKPAAIRFKNSLMDTVLAKPVGVRLRGNTSRYAEKKSFKIDFREFGGKKFFDYKKFNLKANVNDPSLIREPLTLQQFRELGVPAARTHHTRLYINDEYMGVYLNVEQIDDVFLERRNGHSEGYMYKCSWGANLSSSTQVLDEVMFESEINKDTDTRTEVGHFVDVLNGASDEAFVSEIEQVFDVDTYLRYLAVEAVTGHWDGYSYNQNNFYLYYNSVTGIVQFFPYDTDNTWGIDWVGQDWAKYDLTAWVMPGQPRPLTTRILGVPSYRAKYTEYVKQLFETTFTHTFIDPQLSSFQNMLQFSVYFDTYFVRAFGFTYADYLNSSTTNMSNHVKYGLKPYLDERTRTARQEIPDVITSVRESEKSEFLYPNPSASPRFVITSTADPSSLIVYHASGRQYPVETTNLDPGTYSVALPPDAADGLYVIRTSNGTQRWIYSQNQPSKP